MVLGEMREGREKEIHLGWKKGGDGALGRQGWTVHRDSALGSSLAHAIGVASENMIHRLLPSCLMESQQELPFMSLKCDSCSKKDCPFVPSRERGRWKGPARWGSSAIQPRKRSSEFGSPTATIGIINFVLLSSNCQPTIIHIARSSVLACRHTPCTAPAIKASERSSA